MFKNKLIDLKYRWNKLDIEDRIAIITGIIAISLLITPVRQTLLIICLIYLAVYTTIFIYRQIKKKDK